MRLSEIRGERVLEVIADLVEPVSNIAQDGDIVRLFKSEPAPEGIDPRDHMLDRIKKSVPPLMKAHSRDLVEILATLEGVTPSEYEESMTLQKVVADVLDLVTDGEFTAFLSSQVQSEGENQSGSASEITEAR